MFLAEPYFLNCKMREQLSSEVFRRVTRECLRRQGAGTFFSIFMETSRHQRTQGSAFHSTVHPMCRLWEKRGLPTQHPRNLHYRHLIRPEDFSSETIGGFPLTTVTTTLVPIHSTIWNMQEGNMLPECPYDRQACLFTDGTGRFAGPGSEHQVREVIPRQYGRASRQGVTGTCEVEFISSENSCRDPA